MRSIHFVSVVLFASALVSVSAAQRYILKPLDTGVPLDAQPFPDWINDHGDMVILTSVPTVDAPYGSYLLHDGKATPLLVPAGASYFDVNDAGTLLGTAADGSGLLDSHGKLTTISYPGVGSAAFGLNNKGDVAGFLYSDPTAPQDYQAQTGFIWSKGNFTLYNYRGTQRPGFLTNLYDVNDSGDFCGTWIDRFSGLSGQFVVTKGGKTVDFKVPTQLPNEVFNPFAINDSDVVAGTLTKLVNGVTGGATYGVGYVVGPDFSAKIDYTPYEPRTIMGTTGFLTLQPVTSTIVYGINNSGTVVGVWTGSYASAITGETVNVSQAFVGRPEDE